jgi:hypothetical protein
VLQRCLVKNPKERLRDIGDARWHLEEVGVPDPVTPPRARKWILLTAAAVLTLVAAVGWLRPGRRTAEWPRMTVSIVPPPRTMEREGSFNSAPEISPDGRSVLFSAGGSSCVRPIDGLQPFKLSGTRGVTFWSPDSSSIAMDTVPGLVKMRLPDGAPEVIAKVAVPTRGGTWSDTGTILMGTASLTGADGALLVVPASGGEAKPLHISGIDRPGQYFHPEFLPGTDDFLFLLIPADGADPEVYLATLRDGTGTDPVLLLKNDTAARFTPAGGGRLLFVRNDRLYAQRLNRRTRKLEGDADLVADGVVSQPGNSVHRADFRSLGQARSYGGPGGPPWHRSRSSIARVRRSERWGLQALSGTSSSHQTRRACWLLETVRG